LQQIRRISAFGVTADIPTSNFYEYTSPTLILAYFGTT